MRNTRERPKEFALSKLNSVSKKKYLTNNHTDEVTSPSKVYSLNKEAKAEKRQEKGMFPNGSELGNILRVKEITEKKDLMSRQSNGDKSVVLLGVARRVQIVPVLNVYLHTRSMLNLAGTISSHGRLVMNLDATGGMMNITDTIADGKIQHTFLRVQLSECCLNQHNAKLGASVYTQFLCAERVSPRNRGIDFSEWLEEVKEDTMKAMESCLGKGCGYPLRPVVIKMDCALELMNGCIGAFRSEGMVEDCTAYNQCVMLVLLRHEAKLACMKDGDNLCKLAVASHEKLLQVSPCIFKQCKTHVLRAMREYPTKNRIKLPIEMRLWPDQFEYLFSKLANEVTELGSICEVITRMCVLVTIFSTEYLPCSCFSTFSCTQEHHSGSMVDSIAVTMDEMIREQVKEIQIDSDEEFDRQMTSVFHSEDREFNGHLFAQPVLDRMMGTVEGTSPMQFCETYLNKIEKKKGKCAKGIVKVCYVHSPYSIDENGSECVHAQLVGGVTVKVPLPHTSKTVKNPLFSPTAAKYTLKQWITRCGLWAQPSINLTNLALDANVFPCNSSAEGSICHEKNGYSTFQTDIRDVASLIHRRYDESVKVGKLLCNQIDQAPNVIDRRRRKKKKKNNEEGDNKCKGDESEMLWKKSPGTVRALLMQQKEQMNCALERGRRRGQFEYDDKVPTSKWRILEAHAKRIGDNTFMSVVVFRQWLKDERENPLRKEWADIIDNFYKHSEE